MMFENVLNSVTAPLTPSFANFCNNLLYLCNSIPPSSNVFFANKNAELRFFCFKIEESTRFI